MKEVKSVIEDMLNNGFYTYEAMDTAVREIVYDALVYKDNFYDV